MAKNKTFKQDRESYIRVSSALDIVNNKGFDDFRNAVGSAKADFIISEKADFGSSLHSKINSFNILKVAGSDYEINRDDFEDEDLFKRFSLYAEWVEKNVDRILFSETKVYHDGYQYRGTLDLVVIMKGDSEASIIDVKTPEQKSKKWPLQLSAYREAFKLNHPDIKVKRTLILQITDQARIIEYKGSENFTYFLYCLSLKRYFG